MHTRCVAAWLAVWTVLGFPGVVAAADPRGEDVFQESAVLFVDIPSMPELLRRFDRTQFGEEISRSGIDGLIRLLAEKNRNATK